MKRAIIALIGAALLGVGMLAVADEPMMSADQMMAKGMDTNGDGKISKKEYMAYYEKLWSNMKKDTSGRVDAKTMVTQHNAMMNDQSMSKEAVSH